MYEPTPFKCNHFLGGDWDAWDIWKGMLFLLETEIATKHSSNPIHKPRDGLQIFRARVKGGFALNMTKISKIMGHIECFLAESPLRWMSDGWLASFLAGSSSCSVFYNSDKLLSFVLKTKKKQKMAYVEGDTAYLLVVVRTPLLGFW